MSTREDETYKLNDEVDIAKNPTFENIPVFYL